MGVPEIELKMVGPNRFCPDCRRRLLWFDGDEHPMLAPRAVLWAIARVDWEPGDGLPTEVEGFPEALCLKPLCVLKRWRRHEEPHGMPPHFYLEEKERRLRLALSATVALAGLNLFLAALWLVRVIS